MAKVTMKLHGMQELHDALKQLPREVVGKKGGPLKSAMMTAMLPVLRAAQGNVPVDTGNLLASLKRRRHPNPSKYDEIVSVGSFGAFYAGMVEFGTVKNSPRPFLRPAMEENREAVLAAFQSRLGAIIEKEAAKIGKANDAAVKALAGSRK